MKNNTQSRPVIVTTKHRGVFFGYASDTRGEVIDLTGAKMAIYWGTMRGLHQLAETGPTSSSKISAPADVQLRDVTAVFEVTPAAAEVWGKA